MRTAAAGRALAALHPGCAAGDGDATTVPSAAPETDVAAVDTVLQPCPGQPADPAPAGELTAVPPLECLGGGVLDLGRAQGAPTVPTLWAGWCLPCREELPLVPQLADTAGGRLRVVGVVSQDGVPQVTSFAAGAGITFPGAFDGDGDADGDGDVAAALGLRGLPGTAFLRPDGSVAHVEVRPVASAEELDGLVAGHLGVAL